MEEPGLVQEEQAPIAEPPVEGAPIEEPPMDAAPVEEPLIEGAQQSATVTQVQDDHPKLKRIETELMKSIPTVRHADIDRIVLAGMAIMFSKGSHAKINAVMDGLKQSPSEAVAMGIAALISIIDKETKGPLPPPALVPAALILMCQALDFLQKANKVELTDELIAETTQKMLSYMMQKMGLTPEKVAQLKQQLASTQSGQQTGPPTEGGVAPVAPEQGGIVSEQSGAAPVPDGTGGPGMQQPPQGIIGGSE
jgi:hypothetical protein